MSENDEKLLENGHDDDERPIFDHKKASEGIKMACKAFDELDLTLFERWWAAHCIVISASGMLGEKYTELAAKLNAITPQDADDGKKGDVLL